jgi:histidine triad (HIT) family protein
MIEAVSIIVRSEHHRRNGGPRPALRSHRRPTMSDTIFHKIIDRQIPANIVYEDEHLIAFRDIAPQAPVHVLFVPKVTIPTLNDVQPEQAEILGRLVIAAANYAKEQGFAEDGYRIVMNCNDHGGQTVFQIHLHLLAGAPLGRFG